MQVLFFSPVYINVCESEPVMYLTEFFPCFHIFLMCHIRILRTQIHTLYNPGHSIYPNRGSLRFRPVLNGLASIASPLRVIEGGQSPNDVLRAH